MAAFDGLRYWWPYRFRERVQSIIDKNTEQQGGIGLLVRRFHLPSGPETARLEVSCELCNELACLLQTRGNSGLDALAASVEQLDEKLEKLCQKRRGASSVNIRSGF